jgi:hypothetical protein
MIRASATSGRMRLRNRWSGQCTRSETFDNVPQPGKSADTGQSGEGANVSMLSVNRNASDRRLSLIARDPDPSH